MREVEEYEKYLNNLCRIIHKKAKREAEAQKRKEKVWVRIERKLSRVQGTYRSESYIELYALSLTDTPVCTKMLERIQNGLTEKERKILNK